MKNDFILFECHFWHKAHYEVDISNLAKILKYSGASVSIINYIPKNNYHSNNNIPLIDLKIAELGLLGFIPFILMVILFVTWNYDCIFKSTHYSVDNKIITVTLYTYAIMFFLLQNVSDLVLRRAHVALFFYIWMGVLLKLNYILKQRFVNETE